MRYLICLLLLLSLCGCSPTTPQSEITWQYPCDYTLTGRMGEVSCSLTLEMNAPGQGKLSFHTPVELAGVQFLVHSLPDADPESDALQYAERGVTVLLGEMEIPLSEGAYPSTIYGVIKGFSTTKDQLTAVHKQGERSVLTYTYPTGYVTITLAENGDPDHLYIDLYGTTCDLAIQTITYKESTL